MAGSGGITAKEKARRCALAECPLAGRGDPRCADCTGPVAWTENGRRRGWDGHKTHRSCTSCPMDGKGLPVCWAGCDGPRPDTSRDGQPMVMLGGMPDAERYICGRTSTDALVSRIPSADDRRGVLRYAAARFLEMDSAAWRAFLEANSHGDARAMSRISGVPVSAFADGGEVSMLVGALTAIPCDDWQTLRHIILGRSQAVVADMSSRISKQAVNQRLKRAMARHAWVASVLNVSDQRHGSAGARTRERREIIDQLNGIVNTKIEKTTQNQQKKAQKGIMPKMMDCQKPDERFQNR